MTICANDYFLNQYLDQEEREEQIQTRAEELQVEMVTDFLIGKEQDETADELLSEAVSMPEFLAKLKTLIAAHNSFRQHTKLLSSDYQGQAVYEIVDHCAGIVGEHFLDVAYEAVKNPPEFGW